MFVSPFKSTIYVCEERKKQTFVHLLRVYFKTVYRHTPVILKKFSQKNGEYSLQKKGQKLSGFAKVWKIIMTNGELCGKM